MKTTKFNEDQIAMASHLAEQTSVEEVTRKLGIANATFYRWKSKYGGLLPTTADRSQTPKTVRRRKQEAQSSCG